MSTVPPPASRPWPSPELPDGAVPASARPRWRAWTAIVALVAAFGMALFGGLLVSIVAAIFTGSLRADGPATTIALTVVQDACFVAAAVLFARMSGPAPPWLFGLRPTRVGPAIGYALLAVGAFLLFSAGWAQALGISGNEDLPDELGVESSTAALIGSAVLVTVCAPIAEELLFRGFMFSALRNWRGLWPAVALDGIIFGGIHASSTDVEYLVPLMVFGSLLCLVYVRTGSLYPCIALHAVNNAVAFGASDQVGWDWQVPLLAAGALGVIAIAFAGVRRVAGPAPAASPV